MLHWPTLPAPAALPCALHHTHYCTDTPILHQQPCHAPYTILITAPTLLYCTSSLALRPAPYLLLHRHSYTAPAALPFAPHHTHYCTDTPILHQKPRPPPCTNTHHCTSTKTLHQLHNTTPTLIYCTNTSILHQLIYCTNTTTLHQHYYSALTLQYCTPALQQYITASTLQRWNNTPAIHQHYNKAPTLQHYTDTLALHQHSNTTNTPSPPTLQHHQDSNTAPLNRHNLPTAESRNFKLKK